ncbi:unnamed protein product [Protopolystoma xenopodis]|uniref:Uncharacterized protein n=1 Tax=Protopolystoma xenopodis TaxID=117903 RepID=A0A448WWN4_9PLAT|nr:unnamed protein product [Protopolystoma xenopodis]
MMRVIADRFISSEDMAWFEKNLLRAVREEMGPEYTSYLDKEMYFVDFLRDAPEATGDEAEDFDFAAPKIYEPASLCSNIYLFGSKSTGMLGEKSRIRLSASINFLYMQPIIQSLCVLNDKNV